MARRKTRVFERTSTERYATRDEVASLASELSISHLDCRELGHNWKRWVANRIDGGFERALRCVRCKTERWEVLDSGAHPIGKRYVYPDGYMIVGLGRVVGEGRDALRLESIMRTIDESE